MGGCGEMRKAWRGDCTAPGFGAQNRTQDFQGRGRSQREAGCPAYVAGKRAGRRHPAQGEEGVRALGEDAWERGEGGTRLRASRRVSAPRRRVHPEPGTGSYLRGRGAPGPAQPRSRAAPGAALARALASPRRGKRTQEARGTRAPSWAGGRRGAAGGVWRRLNPARGLV